MFWGRRFSAAAARNLYIPIKLYRIATQPVPGASWPRRGSACGVASPAYAGRAVPMREVPSRNPTTAPIRTALPPVREVLRLYVRGSCGFPAIPVRAESARRAAGAGNGGITRQRVASGIPSAILRYSMRWLWRLVCFWKAFRTPCDAAPVLGRAHSRLRIGHRIATRLGHKAGQWGNGVGHHMEGRQTVRGRLLMPQKNIT